MTLLQYVVIGCILFKINLFKDKVALQIQLYYINSIQNLLYLDFLVKMNENAQRFVYVS